MAPTWLPVNDHCSKLPNICQSRGYGIDFPICREQLEAWPPLRRMTHYSSLDWQGSWEPWDDWVKRLSRRHAGCGATAMSVKQTHDGSRAKVRLRKIHNMQFSKDLKCTTTTWKKNWDMKLRKQKDHAITKYAQPKKDIRPREPGGHAPHKSVESWKGWNICWKEGPTPGDHSFPVWSLHGGVLITHMVPIWQRVNDH